MGKLRLILSGILLLSLTKTGNAQVLSQFSWELGGTSACNCEIADIGPNASSVGNMARAKPTGNGSPNGLAPGVRPFGSGGCFTGGGCAQNIDLYVAHPTNTAYFNVPSIELQIDYRNQSSEAKAHLFTRWNAIAFGSDCCGIVYIGYQVSNGVGGFVQRGCPQSGTQGFAVGCPGQTATNTDQGSGNWHTFLFRYEQSTGIGEVFRDGVSSWVHFGTPGMPLYWNNATQNGFVIGQALDGMRNTNTGLDNARISVPVPLPVTLNYYGGRGINGQAYLEWETSSESNNHYYQIERLMPEGVLTEDGLPYEILGRVDGNGTKSTATQYSFVDRAPTAGTNIYVLRQYDFDGVNRAIGKVEIRFTDYVNRIEGVYPNPLKSGQSAHVKYQSADDAMTQVSIYDLSGAQIQSRNQKVLMGSNDIQIDTESLSAGLYFVKIQGNGHNAVEKFVVTR